MTLHNDTEGVRKQLHWSIVAPHVQNCSASNWTDGKVCAHCPASTRRQGMDVFNRFHAFMLCHAVSCLESWALPKAWLVSFRRVTFLSTLFLPSSSLSSSVTLWFWSMNWGKLKPPSISDSITKHLHPSWQRSGKCYPPKQVCARRCRKPHATFPPPPSPAHQGWHIDRLTTNLAGLPKCGQCSPQKGANFTYRLTSAGAVACSHGTNATSPKK